MKKATEGFFVELAHIFRFVGRIIREAIKPPYEVNEWVRQCFEVGWKSLGLISISGFIVGFVFITQTRSSLDVFGSMSVLPKLLAIAVVRSLAPLVTALIVCGRVGSQIGGEINAMRVTDQIDAMDVSGTNPIKFLLSSRVIATSLMVPMLCFYAMMVSFLGGYLSITTHQEISFLAFMTEVIDSLTMTDLIGMVTRAVIFGLTIGVTSCYVGYYNNFGTEGVGKAANRAVVHSIFLIFLEEMLILRFFSIF